MQYAERPVLVPPPPTPPPARSDDERLANPSQQRRLGQQRLVLLHQRGLALALLHRRAAQDGDGGGSSSSSSRRHGRRRLRRRGPRVYLTRRWCGEAGAKRKPRLPGPKELAALQARRHLSRRRRRIQRFKEMKQRLLARERAQLRARLVYKRRYKHKRQEELERKAARRIARVLRADLEAEDKESGSSYPVGGGLVARPIMAPQSAAAAAGGGEPAHPLLQPWAAARVKCESASALVQQTLRASQLLPPEDGAFSGVFDQMLVVGLPLESLREPTVRLGQTYGPQIIYAFPEGALCMEAVADFCLPQGVTVTAIDPATGQPQARPPSPTSAPLPAGLCSRQRARLAAAALEEAKEVLFVLSGGGADGSETSYGMCLHVRRPYLFSDRVAAKADLCYCLIAKHPFLPLHLGVLRALVRMHLLPPEDQQLPQSPRALSPTATASAAAAIAARPLQAELEREKKAVLRITRALHRFAVLPVPTPGEEVSFNVFDGMPHALALPTFFRRPPPPTPVAAAWGEAVTLPNGAKEDDEATRLVREWAVPVLLSLLGLERVLLVLLSMLTEAQVVVVSPDPQVLSASVLALATLVRPLVWAGPLITTLPQKHSDYLDSPVPLIAGVEALPRGFVAPKGMVLVYPERDAVAFHPSEVELYEQLLGHQVAWLLCSLRDAQRLLRRPQRRHHHAHAHMQQQKKQQQQSAEAGSGSSALFPAPRALSPAYGSHRKHHDWCGAGDPQDVKDDEAHDRQQQHQPQQPQHQYQPDRRAVEEVVWRVREHITAVAEAALSIDLVHRPRRPVLDRRRSTIVEENALGAWWCWDVTSGRGRQGGGHSLLSLLGHVADVLFCV
jgi:hypothetical protein